MLAVNREFHRLFPAAARAGFTLCLLLTAGCLYAQTVNTRYGPVKGAVDDGVFRFLGIPYAQPPVGNQRWRPPAEPEALNDTIYALAFSEPCLQQRFEPGDSTGIIEGYEDCLHLNIWTPQIDDSPRPVMVFIHGGGNQQGSAGQISGGTRIYGGKNLAARGDGEGIAANYLNWGDHGAYLDWAGLRPFTEFEFEKACRGPMPVVAGEYAWGTTGIKGTSDYSLANSGQLNEGIAIVYSLVSGTGNGNYKITVTSPGPFRVGIFAAHSENSGRVTSGASYYGIMELSGNMWEYPARIGNPNGRAFNGNHGNGILSATGNHNVMGWPAAGTNGIGLRGGNQQSNYYQLMVGDRYYADATAGRDEWAGGRGARTAP